MAKLQANSMTDYPRAMLAIKEKAWRAKPWEDPALSLLKGSSQIAVFFH